MDPWWESHNGETTLRLYQGDVLEVLRQMPAESVHMVCTSPPYWNLRDYKADGQIGLEKIPEEYVGKMVEVFREIRRVLRRDGTLWLNMGDAYCASPKGNLNGQDKSNLTSTLTQENSSAGVSKLVAGLKPKDLIGLPWRIAFALQTDGWWLRSDIIWSKPNPMPESVTDRPTKAHEYMFLLSKSAAYFYDADAIREQSQGPEPWGARAPNGKMEQEEAQGIHGASSLFKAASREQNMRWYNNGRNKRTVWEIATQPYPEAHFATFPEKLVEPCILAGTSEKGCCPECWAPWDRVTSTEYRNDTTRSGRPAEGNNTKGGEDEGARTFASGVRTRRIDSTLGWRPTCSHGIDPVPCTVLDPFAGSGTTLLVAQRLGRNGAGVELSEPYCEMAKKRLAAEHDQMRLVF